MTTKPAALFLPTPTESWSHCYVRYQGAAGRDTSVKFFFTEKTLWVNFMRRIAEYGGKVTGIDLPRTHSTPSLEELKAAFTEGRAVP